MRSHLLAHAASAVTGLLPAAPASLAADRAPTCHTAHRTSHACVILLPPVLHGRHAFPDRRQPHSYCWLQALAGRGFAFWSHATRTTLSFAPS